MLLIICGWFQDWEKYTLLLFSQRGGQFSYDSQMPVFAADCPLML